MMFQAKWPQYSGVPAGVDFAALIDQLRPRYSLEAIGLFAGVRRIDKYVSGTVPRPRAGELLVEAWIIMTGKTHDELPRVRQP
jgi:hypothetical protein